MIPTIFVVGRIVSEIFNRNVFPCIHRQVTSEQYPKIMFLLRIFFIIDLLILIFTKHYLSSVENYNRRR